MVTKILKYVKTNKIIEKQQAIGEAPFQNQYQKILKNVYIRNINTKQNYSYFIKYFFNTDRNTLVRIKVSLCLNTWELL